MHSKWTKWKHNLTTLHEKAISSSLHKYLSSIKQGDIDELSVHEMIYNDKVDTSQRFGQFFNFCLLIKFYIHEVKNTSTF